MLNLLLTISGNSALTPGSFLVLNAIAIVSLCSLYVTYLFFLTRKRLRAGVYDALPPEL